MHSETTTAEVTGVPSLILPASFVGRTAKLVAGWALLVVIAGGVVTSTRSGDADPHWPTFGGSLFPSMENMLQDLKLFLEHNHRLLAATLGFLTLGLAGVITAGDRRGWVKWLGWLAAVTVAALAVLGGVRVKWPDVSWLPIVHVSVAYVFLGLCITLAVVTGKLWSSAALHSQSGRALETEDAVWLSRGSIICALVIYAQSVLGAVPRHLYVGVIAHVFGAFVVFTVVILVAARVMSRHSKVASLLRPAVLLMGLVLTQFFLGFTTFIVRPNGPKAPGSPLFEIVGSGHQAVGALLIVASVILMVRSLQHRRLAQCAPAARPSISPVSSEGVL